MLTWLKNMDLSVLMENKVSGLIEDQSKMTSEAPEDWAVGLPGRILYRIRGTQIRNGYARCR